MATSSDPPTRAVSAFGELVVVTRSKAIPNLPGSSGVWLPTIGTRLAGFRLAKPQVTVLTARAAAGTTVGGESTAGSCWSRSGRVRRRPEARRPGQRQRLGGSDSRQYGG